MLTNGAAQENFELYHLRNLNSHFFPSLFFPEDRWNLKFIHWKLKTLRNTFSNSEFWKILLKGFRTSDTTFLKFFRIVHSILGFHSFISGCPFYWGRRKAVVSGIYRSFWNSGKFTLSESRLELEQHNTTLTINICSLETDADVAIKRAAWHAICVCVCGLFGMCVRASLVAISDIIGDE